MLRQRRGRVCREREAEIKMETETATYSPGQAPLLSSRKDIKIAQQRQWSQPKGIRIQVAGSGCGRWRKKGWDRVRLSTLRGLGHTGPGEPA